MRAVLPLLILFQFTHALASLPQRIDNHPIGWMHGLNLGTSPGWNGRFWLEHELTQSNVWAMPGIFYRPSTQKELRFQPDYEQTTSVLNLGFQVTNGIALGFEIPSASRGGNLLDKFVDDFHAAFNFYRYQRDVYAAGQSRMVVSTDGVSKLSRESDSGIGNYKFKLLFWPWRPSLDCRCGLGVNFEIKTPNDPADHGLSSGHPDYSASVAYGTKFGTSTYFKASASATYADKNSVFEDWPRNKWLYGGEIGFDFSWGSKWGLIFLSSIQSPFMDENDLQLPQAYDTQDNQNLYQVSSSWNSLVAWRGRHSIGPRYATKNAQISILATEDWGFGARDPDGSISYVDNAPDVAFTLNVQLHF